MNQEILRTSTHLVVSVEVAFPPHVTIAREAAGLVTVLPGELRSLVASLCTASALVAESVATAASNEGGGTEKTNTDNVSICSNCEQPEGARELEGE